HRGVPSGSTLPTRGHDLGTRTGARSAARTAAGHARAVSARRLALRREGWRARAGDSAAAGPTNPSDPGRTTSVGPPGATLGCRALARRSTADGGPGTRARPRGGGRNFAVVGRPPRHGPRGPGNPAPAGRGPLTIFSARDPCRIGTAGCATAPWKARSL